MILIIFLAILCVSYGRSIKEFSAPTLLDGETDEHGCLTNFIYCNYSKSCIRAQERCTPPVPKLELLIKPEVKPKSRPTIKERINVYEIEI